MGYRTAYTIEVYPSNKLDAVTAMLKEKGYYEDECKWYSHEEDCMKATTVYDCVIVLIGYGEERFDAWKKCFCNGKKVWEWHLGPVQIPEVPEEYLHEKMNESKCH